MRLHTFSMSLRSDDWFDGFKFNKEFRAEIIKTNFVLRRLTSCHTVLTCVVLWMSRIGIAMKFNASHVLKCSGMS
jgi:hypothetical protein